MLRNGYLLSLLTLVMVVFAVGCESNGGNNSIITPGPERPDEDPEDGPVVGPGTEEDGMTIEISVTDISAYSAMLTVTPSTDDKYACVFISSAQWPDMIEGDAAVKYIVDNFDPALFQGEYSEELQPLMPDTEYMVIAFGYDGGVATTELFTYTFTSLKAQVGSVEILDIKLLKLFDVAEVAALDPSYEEYLEVCECFGVVEATTSKPCDTLWFWWYEEWMMEEYSEAAIIEDLLMYDYANNPELMDMYYSMDGSDRFFFAGLANDEAGATSELYIGECFTLSKDMCSPAEEFLAMVKKESNSVVMFARR